MGMDGELDDADDDGAKSDRSDREEDDVYRLDDEDDEASGETGKRVIRCTGNRLGEPVCL